MNDALTISGLTKNYKDFKLNGISFVGAGRSRPYFVGSI